MFAGATGAASPSKAAKVAAFFGTEILEKIIRADMGNDMDDAVAQGLQAAANMAMVGSSELMDATIRQHGASPAAALNAMQINMQIQQDTQ